MATYCFECILCGRKAERNNTWAPTCNGMETPNVGEHVLVFMRRDYKAEAVFIKDVPGGFKASGKPKDKESQSDGTDAE